MPLLTISSTGISQVLKTPSPKSGTPTAPEPGDFDWDAFEADVDDYSAEDRASLELREFVEPDPRKGSR